MSNQPRAVENHRGVRRRGARGLGLLIGVVAALALAGCAEGLAPGGDDDDDKFEAGAAAPPLTRTPVTIADSQAEQDLADAAAPTAPPTPTVTPSPTPSPTPTATPSPTPTPTPSPTPTPTPMFPPELIGEQIRVTVGESAAQAIAVDPDSEITGLKVISGPDGVGVTEHHELSFEPDRAGTFAAQVEVTDSQGLSTRGEVTLVSRHVGHPQALVAMGDSVASGHGLDLVDYLGTDLGGDVCWRSSDSYPRRVFDRLVQAGVFPTDRGEFALVACSGYDVDDLWEREVIGGFSDITPADGRRSQLDWAIRSNPRFVTLTIGANDTGFVGPGRLFLADGSTLDRDQVDRRMAVIGRDLGTALDALVDSTDATIFVTNYYNPTANNPQGVPGCREACFRAAAAEVVDYMNRVIEQTAAGYPDNRVVFVDVADRFTGRGAPNGLGPDDLREAGFGSVGALVGADQIGDIHPYCARGNSDAESWINAVDCVHPTDQGTDELAALVSAAIISHLTTSG